MLRTYEQVSKYHPDKYADAIAEAILWDVLEIDPEAHCGIEVMVKNNTVILGGEITFLNTSDKSLSEICDLAVRRVATDLKYKVSELLIHISEQSPELNKAVSDNDGAGDQGIVIGYAINQEQYDFLDYGMYLANKIITRIEELVVEHGVLLGDAKTQVTVDNHNDVQTLIISVCHDDDLALDALELYIEENVINYLNITAKNILINPAGRWTIGGPTADTGITGRKLVADQYGPNVPVGGGNIWGKDYTKVDRSGAMVARIVALDIVKEHLLEEAWKEKIAVIVEIAYAIGKSLPVAIRVKIDGREKLADILSRTTPSKYDFSPSGLRKIINENTRKLNYRY